MPLDPLTALGLATNIVQFIDFSAKLVSKGNKVYKSASEGRIENQELDATSRKVIDLHNRMIQTFERDGDFLSGISPTDREIKKICESCTKVATDVIDALNKLRAQARYSRWQSYRQAFKSLWGEHEVAMLKAKLDTYRKTLDTNLLLSLRERINDISAIIGFQAAETTKISEFLFANRGRTSNWKADLVDDIHKNDWRPVGPNYKLHMAGFSEHLSKATEKERVRQLESQLLGQLKFRDILDREERIVGAHHDTFQWILDSNNPQQDGRWSNFVDWLKGDDKIYWMTGKPGSGKSTLMKFICRDSRTNTSLKVWSGKLPLVLARFYFWNSGSSFQMSQLGFLRSILFDALSQQPHLISIVFPERWNYSSKLGEDLHPWSLPELEKAFNLLVKQADKSFKICLFIDGLDEMDGDHDILINIIKKAVSEPNVKACVGSRPWPVFEEAFSQAPGLMLQNLTYADIVRFTTERFRSSSGFRSLQEREPVYSSTLVMDISTKSDGVFLWVALVVRSLVTGLTNYDKISDLQRRLDDIPSDLEELYEKMFNSIDPFYAKNASHFFQIARAARGCLTALALYFADEADKNLAIEAPCSPLSEDDSLSRYQVIRKRLDCCKGFLEISSSNPTLGDVDPGPQEPQELGTSGEITRLDTEAALIPQAEQDTTLTTSSTRHKTKAGISVKLLAKFPASQKIAYLHRTARDFLESPRMMNKQLAMSDDNFDPHLALLRSNLLVLKTLPEEDLKRTIILDCIDQCMKAAAEVEKLAKKPPVDLLEAIDRAAEGITTSAGLIGTTSKPHWTTISAGTGGEIGFLALAAKYNLQGYIRHNIEQGLPIFQKHSDRPLLDYIIVDYRSYPSLCEVNPIVDRQPAPSLAIIRRLLDNGADPNQFYGKATIWKKLFHEAREIPNEELNTFDNCVLILSHWADIVRW